MILEIERAWHQPPGWFGTLDHETRARLLAWYRVSHAPPPSSPRPPGPVPGARVRPRR